MKGKLYLIPNLLGEGVPVDVLPQNVIQIIREIKYFIVEDIRTTRRYLSKVGLPHPIDSLTFSTLNEHTKSTDIVTYLDVATENNIGIITDAGVPGVADPGAEVIRMAHQKNIQVVPLVGPSSILMAVMASGMNGQSFAFNGYLPIKQTERNAKIRFYEKRTISESQTQLFIETPYRNMSLFDDIISTCQPTTLLGIATDITLETEFIKTQTIEAWKKNKPEIHKRPTIFMLGK